MTKAEQHQGANRPGMKMSLKELQAEWQYRLDERLGILCGSNTPTPEQMKIATDEADQWLKDYEVSLQSQKELLI